MKSTPLNKLIHVKGRYNRSINLDRDLDDPDAVSGYIPTPKSIEALHRIAQVLEKSKGARAFTITAVYGTGKSAFALFLSRLCSAADSEGHQILESIIKDSGKYVASGKTASGNTLASGKTVAGNTLATVARSIRNSVGPKGLSLAVSVCNREPLGASIHQALLRASQSMTPAKRNQLQISLSDASVSILDQVRLATRLSGNGLLLILDELGQSLDYSIRNVDNSSLYTMQQIAELSSVDGKPIVFIGLLHQSFSDYAPQSSKNRSEWQKVEGRFENITLQDAPENSMALLASALKTSTVLQKPTQTWSALWKKNLPDFHGISQNLIADLYPLHPICARILPVLSVRFAQNERSIFNYLSSHEAHSLHSFLSSHNFTNLQDLHTVKIHNLYDYFCDQFLSTSSKHNTRFLEIHDIILESRGLPEQDLNILKTIGIFNMVALWGTMSASTQNVINALIDSPKGTDANNIRKQLRNLQKRGLVLYRKRSDEWRLWEGSDFDIEKEIDRQRDKIEKIAMADFLNQHITLPAQIAQRHSFQTGTLRFFEQSFVHTNEIPVHINQNSTADGFLLLSTNPKLNPKDFIQNEHTKPIVLLQTKNTDLLKELVYEHSILQNMQTQNPHLDHDSIARKEIRFRIAQSTEEIQTLVDSMYSLEHSDLKTYYQGKVWKNTNKGRLKYSKGNLVSTICDLAFNISNQGINYQGANKHQDITKYQDINDTTMYYAVHSDLINRNYLSSQMARARRQILIAMLESPNTYQFGMTGNGPEVSIYKTLFESSGLHRASKSKNIWELKRPYSKDQFQKLKSTEKKAHRQTHIHHLYKHMHQSMQNATTDFLLVDQLFTQLQQPPFGARIGVLPLILFSILQQNEHQFNLYKDGSFIASLNTQVIELLCLRPEKFSIKHFVIKGLRASFFTQIQRAFEGQNSPLYQDKQQNPLSVLKPLIRFVSNLPRYTTQTRSLSNPAKQICDVMQQATQVDQLLFYDMPRAVGLPVIADADLNDTQKSKELVTRVFTALSELQHAYQNMLTNMSLLMHNAFSISKDHDLSQILQSMAIQLKDNVIETQLSRVLVAMTTPISNNKNQWLETVLTVISDKPPTSWTDQTVASFEYKLSDIARRIINLNHIQSSMRKSGTGSFDSPLVTINYASGDEKRELLLLESSIDTDLLILQFQENMPELQQDPARLRALAIKLIENELNNKNAKTPDIKEKPARQNVGLL